MEMSQCGFGYYQNMASDPLLSKFSLPVDHQINGDFIIPHTDTSFWNKKKESSGYLTGFPVGSVENHRSGAVWVVQNNKLPVIKVENNELIKNLKHDIISETKRYADYPDFCSFAEDIYNTVVSFFARDDRISDAAVQLTGDMAILFSLKKNDDSFAYFEAYYGKDKNNDKLPGGFVFTDTDITGKILFSTEDVTAENSEDIISFLEEAFQKSLSSVVL